MAFDNRELRDVMGQFGTGVVIATACLNGVPTGFAAQSFVSLSLDPPLVALCPAKTSTSWPNLRAAGHFCINVLAADQRGLCDLFAKSGGDKFASIDWSAGVTGAPILENILAYVECELEAEHDAGDHTIAVGRVRDFRSTPDSRSPLIFYQGRYGKFTESS